MPLCFKDGPLCGDFPTVSVVCILDEKNYGDQKSIFQVGWGPGQPGLLLHVEVGGPAYGGGWSFVILGVPSSPGHSGIL